MPDQMKLSVLAHHGLLNAGFARLTQLMREDAPCDCVRVFPSISPEHSVLVAFDAEGRPRIRVEMESDEVSADWERWLLKYVRRRYGRRLQVLK